MTQKIDIAGVSPEQIGGIGDSIIQDVLQMDQTAEADGGHVDSGYQKGYTPTPGVPT